MRTDPNRADTGIEGRVRLRSAIQIDYKPQQGWARREQSRIYAIMIVRSGQQVSPASRFVYNGCQIDAPIAAQE